MKSRKVSKKKKPVEKTRKEKRKAKRQEKKQHRAQYHGQKKRIPGQFVLKPVTAEPEPSEKKSQSSKKIDTPQKLEAKLKKHQLQVEKTAKKRKIQLLRDNEEEDKVILQMEKKLKLNKRKSKSTPKSFALDGLDELLDFCNEDNRRSAVEMEKQLLGEDAGSDFEEDLAMVTGKNVDAKVLDCLDDSQLPDCSGSDNSNLSDCSEDPDDFSDSEEMAPNFKSEKNKFGSEKIESKNEKKMTDIEEEISEGEHDVEDEDEGDDGEDEEFDGSGENEGMDLSENSDTWEDIYGRKRDKSGKILATEKYVPPGARRKFEGSSEEKEKLQRLEKELKGLINRLAEHNMHTIATRLDELYMSNSRNSMNELTFKLMLDSICSPVLTPDRLISEHMMLIAILHANVGTEIGAQFLLSLVRKIDESMKIDQRVEDKSLDNLFLMLSHLYNFKVFGSRLLYEILEKLCEKFTEKEIEIILLVLKTVGFILRKDNPVALKELIMKIQQKASTIHSSSSSGSRIQYMLDVLLAIKNNNMNKIPQYNPGHVDHLKKLLKTFLRKGNVVTQFNISLDDLLNVEERGKWWIVGSAWTGNMEPAMKDSGAKESKPLYSEQILELARKQRMNTDVRRNIFCILMTAEDYMDAFEKIHHLGLKDQQGREIIHVLLNCCLQEKIFNPYYAVLAHKFCTFDRKNQMTLQYSLWDKLKSLDDYSNIQLRNLAKFLSHLFLEKGLPLSVLKVVEFGQLDKPTMRLVRQIMLSLFLHSDAEECLQVFERISGSPQLQTFKEGLRLFISHFLMKSADGKTMPEEQVQKLKSRAELADKILSTRSLTTIL